MIAEGFWPCKVLNGWFGENDKGIPTVRINVEVTDGAFTGMRQTYEEPVNNKQAPYIARTAKSVGWKCVSLATLPADVDAWIKETGGISTVEIKHLVIKNGKNAGKMWAKASSIGRGPKPLKKASAENLYDADEAMRAALADDGNGYGAPPPNGDIPPPTDDYRPDEDIPF